MITKVITRSPKKENIKKIMIITKKRNYINISVNIILQNLFQTMMFINTIKILKIKKNLIG
jgi:hypothetical protein